MASQECDILVIGSGLSGLYFALEMAGSVRVTILTKKTEDEANTWRAQGGIAAAIGPDDCPGNHLEDTLNAGAGLSRVPVARKITEAAPRLINRLEALGIRFAHSNEGPYDLGKEGAHTHRRILHSQDATGSALMKVLLQRVREHPNIRFLEGHMAVDLILESRVEGTPSSPSLSSLSPPHGEDLHIPPEPQWLPGPDLAPTIDAPRDRVLGAYVLNEETGQIHPFTAKITLLATGGCGKVYCYTSNSDIATGDGIAMAYRAGARITDLEFVQFHPTCLYHPVARTFLISEAVRGEGGYLTSLSGDRFMEKYDDRGDLASRDIVARAIDLEMKKRGDDHVLLHMEHLGLKRIQERFPNIFQTCMEYGIHANREPIPVVPAAHYMCGGILTDEQGRTDLAGLLAAGEVCFTGLHGANRLASNSLLEAVFTAERAAETSRNLIDRWAMPGPVPEWDPGEAIQPKETVLIAAHWDMMRAVMWNFVGIMRRDHRLDLAARYVQNFRQSIEGYFRDFILDRDMVELRNLALVAHMIVACARGRHESRGLHANLDHPDRDDLNYLADTVLDPRNGSMKKT
ncbi:MAG: FAD-dependent oxidoreductase [Candidatus Eisenbacteria bacterium]|nr:FAD-dependent oxidoreductase [Candidatus Eisenbacteria bacterium]MBU1949239.1 FAD-dependent oxidoreductase [Candidatus Eisenbacteria bacterium]